MHRRAALAILLLTAIAVQRTLSPAEQAYAAQTVVPDLFGSKTLQLSSTPIDAKWHKARGGKLSTSDLKWAQQLSGQSLHERIVAINYRVNSSVHYTNDPSDTWQTASATLRNGRGDCEDYALAKLALLEAAGVPRSDLIFTLARDLILRVDHAVLVVRQGDKLLMLNNMSDLIVDARNPQDYRPVFSLSASGEKWLHGYQQKRPSH